MTTWAVVLLLLLGGLLIARLVFWSREPGPEAWWGNPVGWQMPSVEVHNWKAANRRAEALLAEFLTAEQLQALEKTG